MPEPTATDGEPETPFPHETWLLIDASIEFEGVRMPYKGFGRATGPLDTPVWINERSRPIANKAGATLQILQWRALPGGQPGGVDGPAEALPKRDFIAETLKHAEEMGRLVPGTIANYKRQWHRLEEHCKSRHLAIPTLTKEDAAGIYRELVAGKGSGYHLGVKAAMSYLYGVLGINNPFAPIQTGSYEPEKVEVKHLTAAQLEALMAELKKRAWMTEGGDYFGLLVVVLATALYTSGARFFEWATLHDKAVDLAEREAKVIVKRGRRRTFKIGRELAEALREWRAYREYYRGQRISRSDTAFARSPYLFPGRDGGSFSNDCFNRHLRLACRSLTARGTPMPAVTAHTLRHTAATLLLKRVHPSQQHAATLRLVQSFLGHRSLNTTGRYLGVTANEHEIAVEVLEAAMRPEP